MGGRVNIVKYKGKFLEQPIVQYVSELKLSGSRAVLTRTNMEALLISSLLNEKGFATRLMAGFEGFRVSDLFEIKCFDYQLRHTTGESGIILEATWEDAINWFKSKFKSSLHYDTCLGLIRKFDVTNPEKKLLVDWREYCREINMEDAIQPDSEKIIVATMHKAKGKEYDHVFMMVEDYKYSSSESRRLLYVASSRAKKSLHIHSNVNFYDNIEANYLNKIDYEGELAEPLQYDMILSLKDVSLSSQNYPTPLKILSSIKTGDKLQLDEKSFGEDRVPGLRKEGQGNLLLFSKNFIKERYYPMLQKGYKLTDARVEYIVFWYNKDNDKELKIVLPRLRFKK
jgi:ATP-dependent DNA helicase RecQ